MEEAEMDLDLDRFPASVTKIYEAAADKLEGVPFAGGELTFKGVERTKDIAGADIAVVGCPYDLGTSFRPGARFGPVSGDMVEVATHYEGPAQITALAGANIAADICYLIAHSRREPPSRSS